MRIESSSNDAAPFLMRAEFRIYTLRKNGHERRKLQRNRVRKRPRKCTERSPARNATEWRVEAGSAFFDETVGGVGQAVAEAAALITKRAKTTFATGGTIRHGCARLLSRSHLRHRRRSNCRNECKPCSVRRDLAATGIEVPLIGTAVARNRL